eukprot:7766491-Pyramimonas_sp.AAC.1
MKRAKLFLANFPSDDFGEVQIRKLCSQFGEIGEVGPFRVVLALFGPVRCTRVFLGKGFAFVNFDYRCNAEVAKMQLPKISLSPNTGPLDVRWAASNACIEVHNLGPSVSNEVRRCSRSRYYTHNPINGRNIVAEGS